MAIDPAPLLQRLTAHAVGFVLVGDTAAAAHGVVGVEPEAVHVLFDRRAANRERIVAALHDTGPYLRGVPDGLAFVWNAQTLHDSLDLPLTTTLGDIDLMGQYLGGLPFEKWLPFTAPMSAWGVACRGFKLEALLELERNAPDGDPERIKALETLIAARDDDPDEDTADDESSTTPL